jgi:hypothetical protein
MRRLTRLTVCAAFALVLGSLLFVATPASAKPLRAECADGGGQQVNCEATVR